MSGQKLKQRPHKKGLLGNQSQYSEAFKKQVVENYLSGDDDQRLVASRFGVSQTSLNFWLKKYLSMQPTISEDKLISDMKKENEKGSKDLQQRIKELEKALEEERLKRMGYQTMIEIAEKELKIDIQKKSDTKQSEKMKELNPSKSMELISGLFGLTRQGYYKQSQEKTVEALQEDIVLELVKKVRKKLHRC